MSKRLIFYFIIIFSLGAYCLYGVTLNTINLHLGDYFYQQKDYVKAYKHFKTAFNSTYDDSKYLGDYFSTLTRLNKISPVQNEFLKIKDRYKDTIYSGMADSELANYRREVMAYREDNYLDNITYGDKILRWNISDGVLKYYISTQSGGKQIPSYYADKVTEALEVWKIVFRNNVDFVKTENQNEANFIFLFQDNMPGESCKDATNCMFIAGLTEPEIVNGTLKDAVIKLRTVDNLGNFFSELQIYNTILHETGHALGITGHSYNPGDVMYPVNNDTKPGSKSGTFIATKKHLSAADINTINLLYEMIPDIVNKPYQEYQLIDMVYPQVLLGDSIEISTKKLAESQKYMETVSDNIVSWLGLADSYAQKKDYEKAESAYKTALEYATTQEQVYTIYNNLAVMSFDKKDFDKAILNAQKALSNKSNDPSTYAIIGFSYLQQKKFKEAKSYLKTLCEIEPTNLDYSYALIVSYLKDFDLINGGKEISRIKSNNPAAADDNRIKSLWFISLIFR